MSLKVRHPYVAGRFYPGTPGEIISFFENECSAVRGSIDHSLADRTIYGAVLPHAGYIYSGKHAVHFFELLSRSKQSFDTFIILHPVHRGVAPEIAADASDKWNTPLGETEIDLKFIEASGLPVSHEQQRWEHSAEVMVPFLQHFVSYRFMLVPIGFSQQTPATSTRVAAAIKKAVDATGKKICIIASSDFTHYEHPEHGREMDQFVIDRIIEKDIAGIYNMIREKNISVCGYGPIMCLIEYLTLQHKDELKISVLSRGHSGEAHPSESVVDYVSILFHN